MARVALWHAFLLVRSGLAISEDYENKANPIRKVVNLLQSMQKKVTAEGEKEEELFEKFMCYCKSGKNQLDTSIADMETQVPALGSSIEEAEAKLTQTKDELALAQTNREAAKKAIAESTAIREKEAAAFATEKSDLDTNIAAIDKAVAALEKGALGEFLQTRHAKVLRNIISTREDVSDFDRGTLMSLISGKAEYVPVGGEVTGILKQMGDEMRKSLSGATDDENASKNSYEELVAAKNKEVNVLTTEIETKTKRMGELGIRIVQEKNELSETQKTLLADRKFQAELTKSCATKQDEWDTRKKIRAEELLALAETIKLLNDDDALDLFKSSLADPSSHSFVQFDTSSAKLRNNALNILKTTRAKLVAAGKTPVQLDLLTLALGGKKVDFSKIVKMIEDMREALKKEQVDDDNHKEMCGVQLDSTEDKAKDLTRKLADADNNIAEITDLIAQLASDIKGLTAGIKDLDKSVAEATEQRKADNAEYRETAANDAAAKKLLNIAKNRLNKFYNPKMYKAPAKQELSEHDRIAENMQASLVQIASHSYSQISHRDEPAPPPETWSGSYGKKSQESNGVMAMIGVLISDLDKDMVAAETDEKNAQKEYETMMQESADKRASDNSLLREKTGNKANLEGELVAYKETKESKSKEMMALQEYVSGLHTECDWLLKYHAMRKDARTTELENLANAKSALLGAKDSVSLVGVAQRSLRGQSA